MARLLVEKGADKGKSIALSSTSTIIIGRDTSADLQLRDGMASRMHFKIESRPDGTWLIDLDSLNGTLLNNQPVKENPLTSGDLIKVGETLFSFIADDAATVDSLIGLRIGGYKILERVGRGGMGTVYKAEQIDLQRIVALKVISKEHLKNREFIEMFVHEARAAAKLNHPNIVQVYDVKKFNDLYYFSMEFVPGGNVQELLTKVKRVPVDKALQMILESARGLEYAHKKEIIHRDIKPDNLMISETGSIKIGDLGLAQRMGEKLSADDESSVIGTPHYIAPEQVLGKPADYRSDIYSLGSTMFRMIAAVTPYQAPGVRDLINKKVREDAPNLHQVCPDVPGPVGELCAKMMARNPAQRYASMAEVIVDLERIQRQSTEVGVLPDKASLAPRTEALAAPASNRKLLIAALGLMVGIVLIAGVGAVIVMSKPGTAGPAPTEAGPLSERDANLALDTAKRILIGLNTNSEEALQKAVRQFGDVAERYPGTKAAAAAKREIEECEHHLRRVHADVELASIGELDKTQWTKMAQSFNGGTFDLSLIDPVLRAYETFATGPAGKGTEAAQEASDRIRHIRDWTGRVMKAQEEFLSVKGDARTRIDQRRFQEAWDLLQVYKTKTEAGKLVCVFADHYSSLLFDAVAWTEQQKVAVTAKGEYYKIEADSIAAEQRHEYDKAADLLKPVIESFTQELRDQASLRHGTLVKLGAAYKEAEDRKAAAEAVRIAALDRTTFLELAQEVRDLNVRFEFRQGLDRLAAPRGGGFPRTEEYQERVRDRQEHERRLVDFKTGILNTYSDSSSSAGRDIEIQPGVKGTLKRVSNEGVVIELLGGGLLEPSWKDIAPGRLAAFLQSSAKKRLPAFSAGIAAFCLESGLYEQALDELALLSKTELAEWAAATKKMVEAGETTDSPELEAARRWKHLQETLASPDLAKLIARGWTDIDLLRRVFGSTKFVEGRRKDLDEAAKRLNEKTDEKSSTDRKSGFKQKVLESRDKARRSLDKPIGDVRAQLQSPKAVVPAAERAFQLGELYAATQNLGPSNEQLTLAKNLMMPKGEAPGGDEKQVHAGRLMEIYASLLRNDVLGNNAEAVGKHTNEALSRQTDLGGRGKEEWADLYRDFEAWRGAYDKLFHDGLRDARVAWEAKPDEAEPLWALARAYEGTHDMLSAYSCYAALISEFPAEERVKSGEALCRQADCAYALRAVPVAVDLYVKVRSMDKRIPFKGVDERDLDKRMKESYELLNQLGLGREKKPRKEKADKSD